MTFTRWMVTAASLLLISGLAYAGRPGGSRVVHIGTLDPQTIVVEMIEREVVPRPQIRYVAEPSDEIEVGEGRLLGFVDGRVQMIPTRRTVYRVVDGRRQSIGRLTGDGHWLSRNSLATGSPIDEVALLDPASYRVNARRPMSVAAKAKPYDRAPGEGPRRVTVYLTLDEPMRAGVEYRIDFRGFETQESSATFTYDTFKLRSPAIQTSHVGHRPDDPLKRGLLSQWTGTGGGFDFAFAETFELIDEDDEVAFSGPVTLVRRSETAENLFGQNRFLADVYELDYSEFVEPGTYRLHVPGVGVSHPVRIDEDAWTEAFRLSIMGLTNHRSGIALSSAIAGYERPRPMHPDDGTKVFQTDVTIFNGEAAAIRQSLMRLTNGGEDASGLVEVPNAWGGYMDAGDWDRRSLHLHATHLLIEAFRLNPELFATLPLNLPAEELDNGIPDLLDEILWNVDFYARLQRPDGGVRGGIESTEHPTNDEASWQETLLLGAFEAEPISSMRFAASAAAAADSLRPFDAHRSAALLERAERAFDWAATETESKLVRITQRQGNRNPSLAGLRGDYRQEASLAAVELYRATGDNRFHEAFVQVAAITTQPDQAGNELKPTFAYASLPDELADAELRQAAIDAIVAEADKALSFGRGNTVGVSHRVEDLPMMGWVGYFSTPESTLGPTLTRAHQLTGDERYLVGAIRATSYGVGINPMGMTMTTGLGFASPIEPLHVDSLRLAALPPPGITVYGTHDISRAPDYVKRWTLSRTIPAWQEWPTAESYFDVGNWVEMNEYTVHQTLGPTANYFAYLAARP